MGQSAREIVDEAMRRLAPSSTSIRELAERVSAETGEQLSEEAVRKRWNRMRVNDRAVRPLQDTLLRIRTPHWVDVDVAAFDDEERTQPNGLPPLPPTAPAPQPAIERARFTVPREATARKLPPPPELFQPWDPDQPPPRRLLIDSDNHYPVHDRRAQAAKLAFAEALQIDHHLNLGDHYDFTSISRFDKDPAHCVSLQEELDSSREYWARMSALCPSDLILGNHEQRLYKLLWANPGLFGLRSLDDFRALAGLPDSVTVYPYGTNRQVGLVWGEHGDQWKTQNASHWAMQHRQGAINVAGHGHRLGMYSRSLRSADGQRASRECWTLGHGSSETAAAPWAGTVTGWRHAFLFVEHFEVGDGEWAAHVYPIRIDHGAIAFGGRVYRG